VLVQIPDDVHAAANARRRREGVTWSKLISTLLVHWSAGDEVVLNKPVRFGRPATPEAEEMDRWHEHQMATNERYRSALTETVVPTKTYRNLAELFAAAAARKGRAVAAEVVAAVAALEDEEDGEAEGG